jgi:hypothetical protein
VREGARCCGPLFARARRGGLGSRHNRPYAARLGARERPRGGGECSNGLVVDPLRYVLWWWAPPRDMEHEQQQAQQQQEGQQEEPEQEQHAAPPRIVSAIPGLQVVLPAQPRAGPSSTAGPTSSAAVPDLRLADARMLSTEQKRALLK